LPKNIAMALRLYNTMSARVEEFRPLIDNEVRMYACGPTVYDYGISGTFGRLSRSTFCIAFFGKAGIRSVM